MLFWQKINYSGQIIKWCVIKFIIYKHESIYYYTLLTDRYYFNYDQVNTKCQYEKFNIIKWMEDYYASLMLLCDICDCRLIVEKSKSIEKFTISWVKWNINQMSRKLMCTVSCHSKLVKRLASHIMTWAYNFTSSFITSNSKIVPQGRENNWQT